MIGRTVIALVGSASLIGAAPRWGFAQKVAHRTAWQALTPEVAFDTLSRIRRFDSDRALFRLRMPGRADVILALEVQCGGAPTVPGPLVQQWLIVPKDTTAGAAMEILRPEGAPVRPDSGSDLHRVAAAWCRHRGGG